MPRKKGQTTDSKSTVKGKKGGVAMQHYQNDTTVNPLIGAAIGAAVGGIMGAAAAVALSDKDTRDKLKTAATNLRDQAADRIEIMKSKTKNVAQETRKAAQKQFVDQDTTKD